MMELYLNGTLVENPLNWEEYSETIERRDDIKGLFLKFDSDLTLSGSGYNLLNSLYNSSGYCNIVDVELRYSCTGGSIISIRSNMFLSDCDFNIHKCTVECNLKEKGYLSRIANNKNIKAYLNVGRSKNDVSISTTLTDLKMRQPSTCGLTKPVRQGIDLFDAFESLIAFMSDGQIDFISDWYTNLPPDEKIMLLTGQEIRTGNHTNFPYISFQELFDEIDKKFNIGFGIEIQSNGRYVVRIETTDYFYNSTNIVTLNNCKDVIRSIDTQRLYSEIKIGSNTVAEFNAGLHSLPPVRFLTYNNETYIIKSECNIDRVLDLTGNFIVDSNIIEEIFDTGPTNAAYDDDIFLIQYDPTVFPFPAPTSWNFNNSPPPCLYNNIFRNNLVAARWKVQGDIAIYLATLTDDTFFATQTSQTSHYNLTPGDPLRWSTLISTTSVHQPPLDSSLIPFPFQDDSGGTCGNANHDMNNNYSTLSKLYIVPLTGSYSFRAFMILNIHNNCTDNDLHTGISLKYSISRYNSGGTFREKTSLITPFRYGIGTYADTINASFICDTGDRVQVEVEALFDWATKGGVFICVDFEFSFGACSTFECTSADNAGGVYDTGDPSNYFISRYKFSHPISQSDWELLKANQNKSINFSIYNVGTFKGWIQKIERNNKTSMAEIELVSNLNNS